MHAPEKVAQGRARFDRRAIRIARDIHDAGHGLHSQIHGRVILVRTGATEARAGSVDQFRVDASQRLIPHAESLHRAWRKIFNQHVRLLHHLAQQLATALAL